MNNKQFKALMADNEKILKWVGGGIRKILYYLFPLTLSLSLTALFIALRLDGVIFWSWLWVLAPAWFLFPAVFIWAAISHRGEMEAIKELEAERKILVEKAQNKNNVS